MMLNESISRSKAKFGAEELRCKDVGNHFSCNNMVYVFIWASTVYFKLFVLKKIAKNIFR